MVGTTRALSSQDAEELAGELSLKLSTSIQSCLAEFGIEVAAVSQDLTIPTGKDRHTG